MHVNKFAIRVHDKNFLLFVCFITFGKPPESPYNARKTVRGYKNMPRPLDMAYTRR